MTAAAEIGSTFGDSVVCNGHQTNPRSWARSLSRSQLFENAWFQQRQGTLEREQWESWDLHIRVYYHRPGVQAWWSDRRTMSARGFRNYVEATEPVSGV